MIGETQPIIRIVEVLPAPLGPRKPNDSPGATSKSMASTAVNSPNRLVSPRAWMSEVVGASRAWAGDMRTAWTPVREARIARARNRRCGGRAKRATMR